MSAPHAPRHTIRDYSARDIAKLHKKHENHHFQQYKIGATTPKTLENTRRVAFN